MLRKSRMTPVPRNAVAVSLMVLMTLARRADAVPNVTQAIERAQTELEPLPEVKELIRFVEASERGVVI